MRHRHVATFECDPYFAFHTVNAWDEGDDIHVDLAAYKVRKQRLYIKKHR